MRQLERGAPARTRSQRRTLNSSRLPPSRRSFLKAAAGSTIALGGLGLPLSRVMALHYGEELLDRGLAVIDMRLPPRPALRMTPEAAETYQIRRAVAAIGGEDT